MAGDKRRVEAKLTECRSREARHVETFKAKIRGTVRNCCEIIELMPARDEEYRRGDGEAVVSFRTGSASTRATLNENSHTNPCDRREVIQKGTHKPCEETPVTPKSRSYIHPKLALNEDHRAGLKEPAFY